MKEHTYREEVNQTIDRDDYIETKRSRYDQISLMRCRLRELFYPSSFMPGVVSSSEVAHLSLTSLNNLPASVDVFKSKLKTSTFDFTFTSLSGLSQSQRVAYLQYQISLHPADEKQHVLKPTPQSGPKARFNDDPSFFF